MKKSKNKGYKEIATEIRKRIVKMHAKSGSSHIGSALSIVDILTILYFKILSIDPKTKNKDRDRFILSKGHACSALYATLALRGFFLKNFLKSMLLMEGNY